MVRTSHIHKIFERHCPSRNPPMDVHWGRWNEDETPHVCGVCKPVLDYYLIYTEPAEVTSRWPEAICLTCGWVPRIDPTRTRRLNIGLIIHGKMLTRQVGLITNSKFIQPILLTHS